MPLVVPTQIVRPAGGIVLPPHNPLFYHNVDLGAYADTGMTTRQLTNGGNVLALKDLTGNGNDIVRPSGSGNPTLVTGDLNGLATCDFGTFGAGNNARLRGVFTWNQPAHLFVVFQMKTWSAFSYISDGASAGGDTTVLFERTSTPSFNMFAGSQDCVMSALAVGTYGIIEALFSGASSKIRLNAGTAVTGNPGTANPGGFTMGGVGSTSAGGSTTDSTRFAAAVGYAGALSVGDAADVVNFLNGLFAIF